MTAPTVLIVEPCPAEARFIEDAIAEAMETGAARQLLRPVHLENLDDALIVLAEEKVEALILGSSAAPLRDIARIAECAPAAAIVVIVAADDRQTGVAALRRGAQDYLVRGAFDYAPLARAIENGIERQKVVESWRATSMRDGQTGLLSTTAFSALRQRGTTASTLLIAEWDDQKLHARDAATAWIDAVGHEALPARIAPGRFAAFNAEDRCTALLQETLATATGVGWSVTSVGAADLVRE